MWPNPFPQPHEAEPNFLAELESLQQHGEHGQHVPHSVSSQHVTHSRPENILRRSHSEGTQSEPAGFLRSKGSLYIQ